MDKLDESLDLKVSKVGTSTVGIVINGSDYEYNSDSMTPQEIADKVNSIAKHNAGRAVSWLKSNTTLVSGGKERKASVPSAETQIKMSGDSAKILKFFVNKNQEEIDNNHDITTFFIDTDAEFKKYDVNIPGVCLVVADKRATKASLKKEAIVQKFDKSKTLKRYSDWRKGKVADVDGEVWYCIYVSAKEARDKDVKSLKEEVLNMVKIGYLNEEGVIVLDTQVGDVVNINEESYVVDSVDGNILNLMNEESECEVTDSDIEKDIVELDMCEGMGECENGLVKIGQIEGNIVYSDESDNVYMNEEQLNERVSDKLEGQMIYRDKKTKSPIVTGEDDPKKDTIKYWNTEGDIFTIKKSEFFKKFGPGKEEDFDLFE